MLSLTGCVWQLTTVLAFDQFRLRHPVARFYPHVISNYLDLQWFLLKGPMFPPISYEAYATTFHNYNDEINLSAFYTFQPKSTNRLLIFLSQFPEARE